MKKLTVASLALLSTIACGMRSGTTASSAPPSGPVQTTTTERGVIPAGTTFPVRVDETITSTDPGRTFSAQVSEDILDQRGTVLIPKGSPAQLVVAQIDSGTVSTKTMELALQSVTVRGRRYEVDSDENVQTSREGLGANRRTATMVGGGALLGTLLGAIAGGGTGAAAGAAIGAAGGAAAQVLTRGSEIRVPAETVLTFRLDQPLRLRTPR